MSSRRAADHNAAHNARDGETDVAARPVGADDDGGRRAEHTSARGEDRGGRDDLSAPDPDAGPEGPTKLPAKGWWAALKRAGKEFSSDNVTDWAAALTYYGVLSIFPGVLVLVSVMGLLGDDATEAVQGTVQDAAPAEIGNFVTGIIDQAQQNSGVAGFAAIFGLLGAFWAASGYIAAFMRASNAIYDVPEGRPIWKTLPLRLGLTAVVGLLLIVCAAIVIFTGGFAQAVGDTIGLGDTAVQVWDIAKWPVLVILVSLMISILYWAAPNAKHGGFKWVSPGGIFAVLLWIIASAAFAFYIANFGNYNETYGAVAGVIIFLVWLWISNIAILMGAQMDAELERGRAIEAGHPADDEPFLQLRDDRKVKPGSEKGLST